MSRTTHSDNTRDMVRKGRNKTRRGSTASHAKLTETDIPIIRASTEPGVRLAEKYGVSQSVIRDVKAKRTWKHV